LAYEANFKGWLPSPNNHVDSHPFFSVLKRKKVFFTMKDEMFPKRSKLFVYCAKKHNKGRA